MGVYFLVLRLKFFVWKLVVIIVLVVVEGGGGEVRWLQVTVVNYYCTTYMHDHSPNHTQLYPLDLNNVFTGRGA